MKIAPFLMEEWLTGYRQKVKYNLAESGMRDLTLKQLLGFCDEDTSCLEDLLLEDMPTVGSEYLRQAIADTYHNKALDADRVLVTTGTGEALFLFFNYLLSSGDEVVTSFPAFQALYEVPKAIGAKLKFYTHRLQDNFRFDADRFCDLIGDKTKLVIINNPHNPTGAECSREAMEQIVERARQVGACVLFDEHYRFLPHDKREIIPSGIELGDDLFATGSITKCFGAMGLRMGWLVGDRKVLHRCRDMRDYLTHTLSPISEKLSYLALKNKSKILRENRKILLKNKATLASFMNRHQEFFSYIEPESGVVCFPAYHNLESQKELQSQKFVKNLIDQSGVFVLPASSFEMEGHIRIGLGMTSDKFSEAMNRIENYLK